MIYESKMFDFLEHKINYAAQSFSRDLMNQALGMANLAGVMDLISSDEYVRLSSRICKDYINNPEWFNHPYYH